MANPEDNKPAGRGAAGTGTGSRRSWTESVPRPDQTRSLDFTSLAGGAARARAAPSEGRSAIDEAAILYAGGEAAQAKARLLRELEASPERAWLMLLGLHLELGEKAQFERRAREFEARFVRPAPVWRELPLEEEMLRTGGGAYIGLRGRLTAQSAPQLEQIRSVAQQHRLLRIDFSRLQGADAPGCRLLLEMLRAIRRAGAEAVLTSEAELLGALARATPAGDRRVDRGFWLLRLEILQVQGRRAEFGAAAQQYAQTWGEPPPRYEAPAAPALGGADVLAAPAEIAGVPDAFFGALAAAAATHAEVVVDCGGLRRIDVPSAHALRGVAARLEEHGRRLVLRQVNALVVALLEATGVSALATVVPRR